MFFVSIIFLKKVLIKKMENAVQILAAEILAAADINQKMGQLQVWNMHVTVTTSTTAISSRVTTIKKCFLNSLLEHFARPHHV